MIAKPKEEHTKPKSRTSCKSLVVCLAFGLLLSHCSANADEPWRQWADATGQHEVTAAYVRQTDRFVTLKKQDGRVKILPKSVLSKTDQEHVESLSSAGKASAVSTSGTDGLPSSNGKGQPSQTDLDAVRPAADALDSAKKLLVTVGGEWKYKPIPTTWKLKTPKLTGTPLDRVSRLRLNAEHTHVGAVMPNPFVKRKAVVITDLATGIEATPITLDKGIDLADVDRDGTHIAVVNEDLGKTNSVSVLDANGKSLFVWDTIPGSLNRAVKAQFIDEDLLLVSLPRLLVLWNWRTKKAIYRIGGGTISQLSMKRDTIAVYRDHNGTRHLFLFDSRSGEPVGDFVLPNDMFYEAFAFSPNGSQFATRAANAERIDVWNLTAQPKAGDRRPIGLMRGYRNASSMSWVGEQFVVLGKILVDVKLGMPVWQYTTEGYFLRDLTGVYGNRLVGTAGNSKSSRVARFTFPSLEAVQQIRGLAQTDIMTFGKGAKVKLKTELELLDPEERDGIIAKFKKTLTDRGMIVTDDGEFTVLLSIQKLPARTYRFRGEGIQFERVSYTPHVHGAQLLFRKRVLFTKAHATSPNHMEKKEGETMQQAVARLTAPSSSFFNTVTLPFGARTLARDDGYLGTSELMPETVSN